MVSLHFKYGSVRYYQYEIYLYSTYGHFALQIWHCKILPIYKIFIFQMWSFFITNMVLYDITYIYYIYIPNMVIFHYKCGTFAQEVMSYILYMSTLSTLFQLNFLSGGQEVKFHDIKIQLFQEVKFLIMKSKFSLFMRSNLSNNIDQEVDTLIMRSKPKQALFLISIS